MAREPWRGGPVRVAGRECRGHSRSTVWTAAVESLWNEGTRSSKVGEPAYRSYSATEPH